MGGMVTLRLAALFGSRIEGAVVIDSPLRDRAPEEQAARRQRVFRQLRVYPTREAIIARFRPVPDQPVLGYIADHVAATSIRQVDGGWTWKWDPAVFAAGRRPPAPLTRLDCRVALFRAEHGILSAEMSDIMYDRLGRVAPVIEIPAPATTSCSTSPSRWSPRSARCSPTGTTPARWRPASSGRRSSRTSSRACRHAERQALPR